MFCRSHDITEILLKVALNTITLTYMTWLPAKANRGKTLEPYKKCQSNLEIEPSIVVKKGV
jgi:hypothetical protein